MTENSDPQAPASSEGSTASESARQSAVAPYGVLLIAGVLGAVATFLFVNRFESYSKAPPELANLEPMSASAEETRQQMAAFKKAAIENAAICFALGGAAVAGLMGLACGMLRKSPAGAVVAMIVGGIAGVLLGAAGGYGESSLLYYLKENQGDMNGTVRAILAHAIAWGAVGLAAGIATAVSGDRSLSGQRIVAGLGAGIVGGVLYAPLAMVVFPLANPEVILPEGAGNRALWIAVPIMLTAIALARIGIAPQPAGQSSPDAT